MKPWQSLVKYGAIAFAIILIVNIAVWSLTAIGFVFGLSSSGTTDEPKVTEIKKKIYELDIEIAAAALTIKTENADHITVTTNIKDLKVNEKNGKLTVKENEKLSGFSETDAYVEIVCPPISAFDDSGRFDKVDITTGAGSLAIDLLHTDVFELDLGAGNAFISLLHVKKEADIEGGAGALTLKDCSLYNTEIDMGVGELEFSSRIFGDTEISMGVGEANIEIICVTRDDYKLFLNKGLGEIIVDGEKVGNGNIGNGDCKFKINGGIGEINITFSSTGDEND